MDRMVQKSLQKPGGNPDSRSRRDQEDIKQGEDEMDQLTSAPQI